MTVARDRRRAGVVLAVSLTSAATLAVMAPAHAPASATWSGVDAWYAARGPAAGAFAAIWALAGAVAGWLTVASALQLVASLRVARWLRPLADRVAPAALRGLATAALTATLALSSPAGAGADASPGTATLHPLGAEQVTTTSSPVVTSPAAVAAAIPSAGPAQPDGGYTVRRGDSYWTIARDHLADTGAEAISAREHLAYWRQLMDANADRLVDPGNPDLLYAGQVLVLPRS